MTGAQYVILAYSLAGILLVGYGVSLWFGRRRLARTVGARPQELTGGSQ